jgi:L-lactate dehydrogenase complex protein LldG
MIDTLIEGLRANACTVVGPVGPVAALDAIVQRTHDLVACNADVPLPDIAARVEHVLSPDDPEWSTRLATAAFGVTGARLAVADPAILVLVAAPGAPRSTSLVPPAHICVLRVGDVVPTLADAMARVIDGDLPSALTWIGGPSRTGDLEAITTFGVHGPVSVDVVLLDEG